MAKYDFTNPVDREQCAKDHWGAIKQMASKMSRMLGLPEDEMFGVCAQSLVNSMNTFSDKGFIDKVMQAHPEFSEDEARELASKKNDFTKYAKTMMDFECRAYADTDGRIVRIPVNQIRANMKASKNVEDDMMVYSGVNDRVSLDSLISVSRREVDSDGNFDKHDPEEETVASDLIDNIEDRGRDAEDVLGDLIDDLKFKYGKEKNADEEIGIYRDIVMNSLLADTPDERKLGDIAKERGVANSKISAIKNKWNQRSAEWFKNKGLM